MLAFLILASAVAANETRREELRNLRPRDWLFLGEPIQLKEAVGLILAMIGVLVVQLGGNLHDRAS
jgi:drug/metabolite transporter (DMT)-like permease